MSTAAYLNAVSLVLLVLIVPSIDSFSLYSIPRLIRRRTPHHVIFASSMDMEETESNEWLDKAAKLRKEAEDLESKLREGKAAAPRRAPEKTEAPPPVYSSMNDSVWVLSYRFASKPEPKDDEEEAPRRDFFGGKLTLHFRSDGFTDIASHEPGPGKALSIEKAWGWDVETSNDDDKEYLIFSIDGILPETNAKQRFYFQARQDRERDDSIVLKEGTVTVKQDVSEAGSRWGLFSPKGILAEFRYVGDFAARPTRIAK